MESLEGDLKELRSLKKTGYLSQDSKTVSYNRKPKSMQKSNERKTSQYELEPTFGQTQFLYEEPQMYPMLSYETYKAMRYAAMFLDVLALIHVLPAPFDHPWHPCQYPKLPKPNRIKYTIVEPDSTPKID